MDTRRALLRAATLTAVSLLLTALIAACGGGGDDGDPTATPSAPGATATSAPSAEGSVTVDQTFWHAGFKVTLEEATLASGDFGSAVTIDALFENTGPSNATFNSVLVLTSGGNNYTEASRDNDFPEVPGDLSGRGVIGIEVDEAFTFDDAVLIVGNPDNNQATVPLTPGAGELVSLEPLEIEVLGAAVAGAVTVNVERVELRADLPDWHQEMEDGILALIVYFSVDVGTGIPIGEGVFQSQNIALRLPDGTAVAVRSDGRSGVNELLQGKEGTSILDLSARFEVPAPAAGEYAFIVRGPYVPSRETVEDEAAFEVPGP